MFENLESIKKSYIEISARLEQNDIYSDIKKYNELLSELNNIEPIVKVYEQYLSYENDLKAALELEDSDEIKFARSNLDIIAEQLKILLLPKDPNDDRNVIFEIRSGVGGEEGALFASDLFRMYSLYSESQGWKIQITNISETELGGIKEIAFIVEGKGAYSKLKYEAGGHRVQRVPVTESGGRIHTSAATVAVLPEIDEVTFNLDLNDVRIDVFRSSGAGGQKVNKTSSAIRVTYIPTGLVVECQDERSQYKNKDRALQILRSKLYEEACKKQDAEISSERKNQVGTGDRSDRIRTYNFPQNRVTDHRLIGEDKNFNLESIINGNLDPIIDSLITQDRAYQLSNIL